MQSKDFEQAIKIMGDTNEDMDIEIEQKDIEIGFLEFFLRLPDSKVFEEQNSLGLKKYHPKKRR